MFLFLEGNKSYESPKFKRVINYVNASQVLASSKMPLSFNLGHLPLLTINTG